MSRKLNCRILVLALLSPALPVMEMQDETPPEKLPPPVHLAGIGNAHLEITAAPEARIWFDQGLNLLHDYWDYESARAFEQGVRVDPNCAMCFWGLNPLGQTWRPSAVDGKTARVTVGGGEQFFGPISVLSRYRRDKRPVEMMENLVGFR